MRRTLCIRCNSRPNSSLGDCEIPLCNECRSQINAMSHLDALTELYRLLILYVSCMGKMVRGDLTWVSFIPFVRKLGYKTYILDQQFELHCIKSLQVFPNWFKQALKEDDT